MAWKDLSIAQRSQLMNMMRHNGILNLSEMRRLYDLSSPSLSSLEENTFNMQPQAPVYAGGGNIMRRGGFGRHDKSQYGVQYYDVVNMHYNGVMNEMRKRGFSFEDAQRLAPFLVAQLTREGGWRNDRADNNYGGLRVNNGTKQLEFDSLPEFYTAYIDTLDRRWGASRGEDYDWRRATSLEDYAARLNRDDLGLHTKAQYDAYNAAHRDNPVYLYTPEWDNSNRPLSSILNDTRPRADAYLSMIYQEDPIADWDEKFTGQPPRGSDFYTHLWRGQEEGFQNWYSAYAKINGLDTNPNDPRHAYDYRGFYRSLNDWQRQSYLNSPGIHLPDTYKWPTHPTFSQESKYYNSRTMDGVGTWEGENFKEGEYNRAMQNMDAFNLSLEDIQRLIGTAATTPKALGGRLFEEGGGKGVKSIKKKVAKVVGEAAKAAGSLHPKEVLGNIVSGTYQRYPELEAYLYGPDKYYDKAEPRLVSTAASGMPMYNADILTHLDTLYLPAAIKEQVVGKTVPALGGVFDAGNFSIRFNSDGTRAYAEDVYDFDSGLPNRYRVNGNPIYNTAIGLGTSFFRSAGTPYAVSQELPVVFTNDGEYKSNIGSEAANNARMIGFASGGKIHIKPENRGKFNALLKRTGKSASWFKKHGTPLQRKRATFALNARKWKHAHGGIKF